MTTIYFMRHSETLTSTNVYNNDSFQLQNEKWVLTKNGEEIAVKFLEKQGYILKLED